MYRQLGCQHHLVSEDDYTKPEIPGLTPRGFARWATLLIMAHPEEEFERLRKAVVSMPIDNPDYKERFPKDITRRLFPEHRSKSAYNDLSSAMAKHSPHTPAGWQSDEHAPAASAGPTPQRSRLQLRQHHPSNASASPTPTARLSWTRMRTTCRPADRSSASASHTARRLGRGRATTTRAATTHRVPHTTRRRRPRSQHRSARRPRPARPTPPCSSRRTRPRRARPTRPARPPTRASRPTARPPSRATPSRTRLPAAQASTRSRAHPPTPPPRRAPRTPAATAPSPMTPPAAASPPSSSTSSTRRRRRSRTRAAAASSAGELRARRSATSAMMGTPRATPLPPAVRAPTCARTSRARRAVGPAGRASCPACTTPAG